VQIEVESGGGGGGWWGGGGVGGEGDLIGLPRVLLEQSLCFLHWFLVFSLGPLFPFLYPCRPWSWSSFPEHRGG